MEIKKKVFILLNGEPPIKFPDLSAYSLVCATDGAFNTLNLNGITPDFISGDFDSVNVLPKNIEVISTPDQNFTDFHKILHILKDRGFYDIHVFGASGKEQDHFLGNLHTALQWKGDLKLTFFDDFGFYFLANKNEKLLNCYGKKVSLFPFPSATEVTTAGLKYALNDETLAFEGRIGTRNIAIADTVVITFREGNLFLFVNQ